MNSINEVNLLGNLGGDPELVTFQDGNRVCNLNIATSQSWIDKQSGQKQERTEWHRVILRNGTADVAAKYLRKGSKVHIKGSLQTRKYQDNNGQDRFVTEIIGSNLIMLDSAPQH